ncbi:hypothetical protein MMSR116_18035 [Methylobacterium mesophilicum SR1.6/6]|uniref:Arc family DNA-binding protein n=1 Tax=Methylobacterium mesophilicum SR1.6/6 TaxID=908290 RepID=A0A6B9FRI4_9HYPH|nr:hypothetical protein [Methylobacterium mesophilicum]QGY03575.1 hypothetical protein MMSR116_18035 [Methylobacterium mesophilicum SR1.6/6]
MAIKAAERENKRSPLNMRTTAKLRDALEREASKADRSLAQEVEARLERSFQEDELLAAFIGDQTHSQLLVRVLAATVRRVEALRGDRFVDSPETAWHCRNGINFVLSNLLGPDMGPPRAEDGSDLSDEDKRKEYGFAQTVAHETLKDFGIFMHTPKQRKSYQQMRSDIHAARAEADRREKSDG